MLLTFMRAAHLGAPWPTLLAGAVRILEIWSAISSLVMESNVLAAGISAEVPTVTASGDSGDGDHLLLTELRYR